MSRQPGPRTTADNGRGGRLVLWPGRGMYLGPLLAHEAHAHHAIQLSVGFDEPLRLQTQPTAPWHTYRAVVSGADQSHRIACGGILAQLYFDPESTEGRRLSRWLGEKRVHGLRPAICDNIRCQLRRCWMEGWDRERCSGAIDAVVGLLVPGKSPQPMDSRVARVVAQLHASPHRVPPLAALAAGVSLSSSRLAHLFRIHTGLPIRRYALWLRLNEALRGIATGAALTATAYESEFSDSAHLTRTFHRMFGMPPSALRNAARISV